MQKEIVHKFSFMFVPFSYRHVKKASSTRVHHPNQNRSYQGHCRSQELKFTTFLIKILIEENNYGRAMLKRRLQERGNPGRRQFFQPS